MKFFDLIEGQKVFSAPEKKVIPAEEFSQLSEAAEILKKTHEEEEVYRKKVFQECEQLKEQAEKEGFEKGLKQWNKQLAHLEEQIAQIHQEMEKTMTPLALTSVKKIIGKELETKPDTIADIISQALKAVSHHRKITIYVRKSDLEIAEENRPEFRKLFEHLETLNIATRDDIAEGGCIIETEAGIINAQLESQLDALKAALHNFFQNQKKNGG